MKRFTYEQRGRECEACGFLDMDIKRIRTQLGLMWEYQCPECDHKFWKVA